MDEKTEELRELFMEVSDEGSVTEQQEEGRGTLAESRRDVDERLAGVITRMRETYGFETALDDEALCRVVRGYYDGRTDGDLAADLEVSPDAVRTARLALHLIRDDDAEGVDLGALREVIESEADADSVAAEFDVDEATLERAREVLQAREESRRAGQRYRSEFEEILTDADLTVRLTASVQEDGLEEATEDIETDVDF